MTIKTCPTCGNIHFEINKKYCSDECLITDYESDTQNGAKVKAVKEAKTRKEKKVKGEVGVIDNPFESNKPEQNVKSKGKFKR